MGAEEERNNYPDAESIMHQVASLTGIYSNPISDLANPNWQIDKLPEMGINVDLLIHDHPEQRRLKLINPITFCTKEKPRFYPLSKCTRLYSNETVHRTLLSQYLKILFDSGVLYKRFGRKQWILSELVTKRLPYELTGIVNSKYKISSAAVTGKVFLVNKNPHDTEKCRLVVNYSQYSHMKFKFPKYCSPNLKTLQKIIPPFLYYKSLDLKSAFFQLRMNPDSLSCLTISDGSTIYGWRMLPMGLGLSPWALTMLTNSLADIIRNKFKIFVFAYMDDFILGSNDYSELETKSNLILDYFQHYGILINNDKSTPTPQKTITFMGREFTQKSIKNSSRSRTKLIDTLTTLERETTTNNNGTSALVGTWVDFKIHQRLVGLIAYNAPFTHDGYYSLKQEYKTNQTIKTSFWPLSKIRYHLYNALNPIDLYRQRSYRTKTLPRIYTDASGAAGAITNRFGVPLLKWNWKYLRESAIHIKEGFAAYIGHRLITSRTLGEFVSGRQFNNRLQRHVICCDNSIICQQQSALLFPPYIFKLLDSISIIAYIHTSQNPADFPSRDTVMPTNFLLDQPIIKELQTRAQKLQQKLVQHVKTNTEQFNRNAYATDASDRTKSGSIKFDDFNFRTKNGFDGIHDSSDSSANPFDDYVTGTINSEHDA